MTARVVALLLTAVGLVACVPNNDQAVGDPEIREATAQELRARRENEARDIAQYEAALATARVYRSEIRDSLIEHPERYRASGAIGLGDLWHGADRSKPFRCIHPQGLIDGAMRDGWQLVKCDRRSAYFLRGPVVPHTGNGGEGLAPTVEEAFEVLKVSIGSADQSEKKGSHPNWPPAIRLALPTIYDGPKREDLVLAKITLTDDREVRSASYDFGRRKEISVYDEGIQTVVTVIFANGEEPTLVGSKGVRVFQNAVVWAQSPRADFSGMTRLLSHVQIYVGGIK